MIPQLSIIVDFFFLCVKYFDETHLFCSVAKVLVIPRQLWAAPIKQIFSHAFPCELQFQNFS